MSNTTVNPHQRMVQHREVMASDDDTQTGRVPFSAAPHTPSPVELPKFPNRWARFRYDDPANLKMHRLRLIQLCHSRTGSRILRRHDPCYVWLRCECASELVLEPCCLCFSEGCKYYFCRTTEVLDLNIFISHYRIGCQLPSDGVSVCSVSYLMAFVSDMRSMICVGLGLGVWVAGNVSGGHVNPAVTLTLATFRGFPWRKVPIYWLAQLLGGILGAAIVYATYFHEINRVEGGRRTVPGTAQLFGNYPVRDLLFTKIQFLNFVFRFPS